MLKRVLKKVFEGLLEHVSKHTCGQIEGLGPLHLGGIVIGGATYGKH